MNEMPAGTGHNLGPIQLETRDELQERLEREDRALFDRVTELEFGAQQIPATIPNEEIAAQVTTDIAKYHLVISDLEARHKRLKAPYFAIGRWLDDRYLGRARIFRAATARADRAI